MLFNWVPDRILYITDPVGNALVALTLVHDGMVFQVDSRRHIRSDRLDLPVDMAPAVSEVVNPAFASNTTLAGGSDIYVANRVNGTIVRLRQDGTMVAVRQVAVTGLGALGPGRLNGIAVSRDAQKLWVTVSGALPGFPGVEGAVLELPAFGASTSGSRQSTDGLPTLVAHGEVLFHSVLSPRLGLGPLFNALACVSCHNSPVAGGMGTGGLGIVIRVGQRSSTSFDPLLGRGGPVARVHSVAELNLPCWLPPGIPAEANLTSVRNAPALFGLGLIETIPDEVILAGARPRRDGVRGRPNLVRGADGRERPGRFGWKAHLPTLDAFVAEALRTEHGITNPLAPVDNLPTRAGDPGQCASAAEALEDDGTLLQALTAFVASLAPPVSSTTTPEPRGRALFDDIGCALCHLPSLQAGDREVWLYSDLLLHDMGSDLDDGVLQEAASGRDWRTTPLWGVGDRTRFLHDGHALTLREAILAHGGEAAPAVQRFRTLSPDHSTHVLTFLASLTMSRGSQEAGRQ
jgi:hypothetical protein